MFQLHKLYCIRVIVTNATISSASFLKQKRHEALVSHLLASTHDSVKVALLVTPSLSLLFSDGVINASLTQVKEDLRIKLLPNLHKGVVNSLSQLFPPRFVLVHCYLCCPLQDVCPLLTAVKGGKHPYSSSPVRRSKLSFDTSELWSPTPKK